MAYLGEYVQHADWKSEKHAPVIHCAEEVTAGEFFEVKVNIGEEIGHPNTTEHHITWISLFFKPEGDKFVYEVGHYEFNGHGASVKGPNQGPVYNDPMVVTSVKVMQPGTFHALAMCNIHGLWEGTKEIRISSPVILV